jgi:hypothetical protein
MFALIMTLEEDRKQRIRLVRYPTRLPQCPCARLEVLRGCWKLPEGGSQTVHNEL